MSFSPQKSSAEIIDRIVAQVGDKIITQYDIETFAPERVRTINAMSNEESRKAAWDKYYGDTIQLLIDDIIVQTSAARVGKVVTEQQIDEAIVVLQEQNSQFRAHVKEVMDREGRITPELRMTVKALLLQEEVSKILVSRAIVTEEDIRNYYKNDPNVKFGQISYNLELVFLPDSSTYNEFAKALKGGTFEEAVNAVSQNIVRMGWVTMNQLVPEMSAAVGKLATGEVSPPVVDADGRHAVIKVVDTKTETNIPDSLRQSAVNKIREDQLQAIFTNWIERNKKSILVYRYDQ